MTEVEIERCGAGGSGVGRLDDGMVVFVPRTAPGDRVSIEVTERKRRWAGGSLVAVSRPSAARVDAQCPHYITERCGGCQFQHIAIETQRVIKGEIVGEAIRRIGKRECANPVVVPSHKPWRYRRKIVVARGPQGELGFHVFDDPAKVFDLADCLITEESIMDVWSHVRAAREALPQQTTSVTVCRGRDGHHHVLITTDVPVDVDPFVRQFKRPDVCVWTRVGKVAMQCSGPETDVSPESFEQANDEFANSIREFAVESLGGGGGVAWDLYGGFGDTAKLLAGVGFRVWSVDVDPAVRKWAQAQWPGLGVKWVTGQVERKITDLPEPDVVVLNPPRSGLAEPVSSHVNGLFAAGSVRRAVYVSCDPATLARDLNRMPSAHLLDLRAYDLFPQTSHVETVVVLGSHE